MPTSARQAVSGNRVLGPPARRLHRLFRRLRPAEFVPPPPPRAKPGRPVRGQRVFLMDLPPHPAGRWAPPAALLRAPARFTVPARLNGGLGAFELDSVATFLALCQLAPAGDVLDVGANTGHYSFMARAYSGRRVVAFEPVPELAQVARQVGHDNSLPFVVEEAALGDRRGTATLYLSDVSDSSNSLREGFRASSHQIEVPVHTLDGYTSLHGLAPSVIKIDTETTEADVLRGGIRSIRRYRPWIVCEVLPGRGEAEIQEVLEPLGYRFHPVGGSTPFPRQSTLAGREHEYNWLFAPADVPERWWRAIDTWRRALATTVTPPAAP